MQSSRTDANEERADGRKNGHCQSPPQAAHQAGSDEDEIDEGAGNVLTHGTGDKLYSNKQRQKNSGTAQRFQAVGRFGITHN